MDDERQARSAARAYLEQRQPVSEKLYAGEVLSSCRSFAWVKLQDELDNEVPEAVLEQLRDMTAGVKRKAAARKRPIEAEYVVYVSCLDLLEPQILRPGAKVALKLYTDTKGVGGYDVQVTEQAEARPEEVSELRPSEEKENVASSRPRYMRFFENKVAEEERQLLEGSYEGEVVRRAKTYAWIRPLSEMPEEVAPKIQEMCDRFRQKAEEMGGKPFCGGTEENVVYVANPDLSNKGTILSVGMKVSFKLYLDNKGVGAYEVVPSEEHIEKMLELIRKNFETEEGRAKSLPLAEVFGADDLFKDVLWVGECTHAFSLAAGRLVGVVPYAGADEHPFTLGSVWCSTELQWPRTLEKKLELDLVDNLKLLRKHGVWCSDGINALQLKESLERAKCPNVSQGFDTVFWMMPYVPDGQSRPATSIAIMMHYYIQNYLESAAKVCKENGQLVVVVTSAQCLNWNLYKCKPTVNDEDVTPQVRWFDVGPFERHGYQSRFGDGRDRYVEQPVFHRLCDTVAVIWRMDHGSLDPGVTEEEILARKKLLEEVGTDRPEKEAESENV